MKKNIFQTILLSFVFSSYANAQLTSIPADAIYQSTTRALDRWRVCGGRFEVFANRIGNKASENYIAMPKFNLTDKDSSTSKSSVNINRNTEDLDLSLEKNFSIWLGSKFKKVKNAGTFYDKTTAYWYAKFDPMALPCETIVHHLQALGPPIKTPAVYSPKYGIKIYTQGYGYTNEEIAQKRREYIQNRVMNMRYLGLTESQVYEFETRALEMTQTPLYIENLTDESIDWLKDLWRSCGGKYETFVNTKLNVSKINSITLMPAYFKQSATGDMWLAGVNYTDKGIIKLVSYFAGANPGADGSPVFFSNHAKFLLKWEIGHTFYYQFGYNQGSGNVHTEGGSKRPCDFLPTQNWNP